MQRLTCSLYVPYFLMKGQGVAEPNR
ncbi:hypothetical protein GGQ80_001494 [Sphingomonas jinjuensis]|uniref:Uncharacterized protein n=1 Tax=Sphingomonas jinjuensis TaxID=535907 RepID=A0A840FAE1_9SPHN|nr:hypothetical protein [Sphingomonas jinjuensis]